MTGQTPSYGAWRNAVFAIFALNGLATASWMSRMPANRDLLHLDPGQIGLLLVGGAAGAIVGLLASSHVISFLGGRRTLAIALVGQVVALVVIGLGVAVAHSFALAFVGLALFGVMSSTCDVAMNVEGTAVEHRAGRTILPLMHAAWSFGTIAGAGLGSLAAALSIPPSIHLPVVAVIVLVAIPFVIRFIPARTPDASAVDERGASVEAPRTSVQERLAIWLEPRTLLIGVIVLGMAFAEGSANDWLQLAMIDARHVDNAQAAGLFAVFTAAMTLGRIVGSPLTDRIGRVAAIRLTALLAIVGLCVMIFVPVVWVDIVGIVLWGFGASLGFPLGMSAAADDPRKAAARVSAVATVGYFAFLVGPPVIGFLGDHVGIMMALLLVVGLIALSLLATPAARETGARARAADADVQTPSTRT